MELNFISYTFSIKTSTKLRKQDLCTVSGTRGEVSVIFNFNRPPTKSDMRVGGPETKQDPFQICVYVTSSGKRYIHLAKLS